MYNEKREDVLRQAERQFQELERIAREEREALIHDDISALPAILSKKEVRLRNLLRLRPELESLRRATKLRREGREMELAARKLKEAHSVNKRLLAVRLEGVEAALSLLRPPAGEEGLYGPGGRAAACGSGGVLKADF